MAKVKLAANLPKDDTGLNGLDEAYQRLVDHPGDKILVVGYITAAATNVDHKRGNLRTPTVEFHQIEVVKDTHDHLSAQRAMERAQQRRLGKNPDQLDLATATGLRIGNGTRYTDDQLQAETQRQLDQLKDGEEVPF